MLKRSGFKRPERPKAPRPPLTPPTEPAKASMGQSVKGVAVPKAPKPVRSKAYRMAVAKLRCYRCRVDGYTQVCHGDFDKGMAKKTSDLTCWPGCGPRPAEWGCHHIVGRHMERDERRAFEIEAAADTQLKLIAKSQETGREAQRLRALLVELGIVR